MHTAIRLKKHLLDIGISSKTDHEVKLLQQKHHLMIYRSFAYHDLGFGGFDSRLNIITKQLVCVRGEIPRRKGTPEKSRPNGSLH